MIDCEQYHEAAQRMLVRGMPGHPPHCVHFECSACGRSGMSPPLHLRWRGTGRGVIVKRARIPIQIFVVALVHLVHDASPPPKMACHGLISLSVDLLDWNIGFQEFLINNCGGSTPPPLALLVASVMPRAQLL